MTEHADRPIASAATSAARTVFFTSPCFVAKRTKRSSGKPMAGSTATAWRAPSPASSAAQPQVAAERRRDEPGRQRWRQSQLARLTGHLEFDPRHEQRRRAILEEDPASEPVIRPYLVGKDVNRQLDQAPGSLDVLPAIKAAIVRREPDFDERDHGFSSFSRLLEAMETAGLLRQLNVLAQQMRKRRFAQYVADKYEEFRGGR